MTLNELLVRLTECCWMGCDEGVEGGEREIEREMEPSNKMNGAIGPVVTPEISSADWFADYVAIGPRFSNVVLQALLLLIKTPPPKVWPLSLILFRYMQHTDTLFLSLHVWCVVVWVVSLSRSEVVQQLHSSVLLKTALLAAHGVLLACFSFEFRFHPGSECFYCALRDGQGRRLLVMGTTSAYLTLREMGLARVFNVVMSIPNVSPSSCAHIMTQTNFLPQAQASTLAQSIHAPLPIKQLIVVRVFFWLVPTSEHLLTRLTHLLQIIQTHAVYSSPSPSPSLSGNIALFLCLMHCNAFLPYLLCTLTLPTFNLLNAVCFLRVRATELLLVWMLHWFPLTASPPCLSPSFDICLPISVGSV